MQPYLTIGGKLIPAYGVLIIIGCICALGLILYRATRHAVSREDALYAWLFGVIGLIVGGKLLYLLPRLNQMWEYRSLLMSSPQVYLDAFFIGGFVYYGGLLGGGLLIIYYCRKYNLAVLSMFDLFAPSVALAHGIGRLGCFMAGCCYGIPAPPPWGIMVSFPQKMSLFPVQLLESGLNLLLCILLLLAAKKLQQKGQVAGLYLVLYSIMRFGLEFLRGDPERGMIFILTVSQWIGIALFFVGVYLLKGKDNKKAQQKITTAGS